MDINTIKDDVQEFNDSFFNTSLTLIDNNFDFIDTHQLYQPKQNYLFTYQFLTQVFQKFKNIDYSFSSVTLDKLYKDINNLYKINTQEKQNLKNIQQIFEDRFITSNQLFIDMHRKMRALRTKGKLDEDEVHTLKLLTVHIRDLKKIYFEYFKEDFTEQVAYIKESLKHILNSKIYYFDRLIWLDTMASFTLHKEFERLGEIKSSQIYVLEMLKEAHPCTDNYKYLQDCLKVYK